jgi:hypothetical protein
MLMPRQNQRSALPSSLHRKRFVLLVAVVTGLLPGSGRGDEPPATSQAVSPAQGEPERAQELNEEQVDQLINDLDHADFKVREEATRRLAAGGAIVVPAVEKAACGDNLEVATRSLQVLKMLYEGKDIEAQADAAIAIKRLCDSPNKSISRRAAAILDGNQSQKPPDGAARLPALRLNARAFPAGGVARQVSVQNFNGQVQVSVVEANRRIEIKHNNQRQIVVKITDSNPEGAPKETREYKGEDLKELRDRHPEVARLFEEYAGDNDLPDLGANLFPGGFPPGFPQLPGLPRGARGNLRPPIRRRLEGGIPRPPLPDESVEALEKTQNRLRGIVDRLKRLATQEQIAPQEMRKLADELKAIEEEVQESADDLRDLGRP